MACFLVSTAEAIAVKAVEKRVESAEQNENRTEETAVKKIPFSRKLHWLFNLLLGGSVLLAFEHIWHGEVVPWFPFLTAMSNVADRAEMFREMATVGVGMAVLVTVTWGIMCVVADSIVKREPATVSKEEE